MQFGIRYTEDVEIVTWGMCQEGQGIYESGWPGSGTAAGVVFEPAYPAGPDSLVAIGYFLVAAGSTGYLQLTVDERIGSAIWVDEASITHTFNPNTLGRVDINGELDGYTGCGTRSGAWTGGMAGGMSLPASNGESYGPMWVRTFEGFHTPIAVDVATTDDANNSDLSGVAAVFMASDTEYLTQRVKINGTLLTPHLFGVSTDVDVQHNREVQLAVARNPIDPPGSEPGATRGWVFQGGSGEYESGTHRVMLRCTETTGATRWELNLPGNHAESENTVGAVVLNDGEHRMIHSGRWFNDPGSPPNRDPYKRICRHRSDTGESFGCGNYFDRPISEVVDSEFVLNSSEDPLVYVVGKYSPDGFVLTQASVPPESGTIPSLWDVTYNGVDDEEAMVLAGDSDGNAIVVLRVEEEVGGQFKSRLSVERLSVIDGSLQWSVAWSKDGAGAMEVMDVAVDDADNLYIAGRFSDPGEPSSPSLPGIISFAPDASEATDYRWFYHFPDGGSAPTPGVARALKIDDENACLYITGESDSPDDQSSELQMYVACLAVDGTVSYSSFVDPSALPTSAAAIGAGGFSVGVATDPYQFAPDDVSYVYVLGRAYHETADPTVFLARYPTGGCSPVAVGDWTGGAIAEPRPFWTVCGGAALEVQLLEPAPRELEVRVFDVSGRLVADRQIAAGAREARFAELPSGVFFVRTVTDAGRAVSARAVVVR